MTVLIALPLAFATLAGCTFDGDDEEQRQGDFNEMGVFQVYLGTKSTQDDDEFTNIFDDGSNEGTNGTGNQGSGLNGTFDDADEIEDIEITVSHIFLGSGDDLRRQDGRGTGDNGTDGMNGTTGTTGTDDREPDENDRGESLDDNAFETRDGDSQVGAFHLDEEEQNTSDQGDGGSPEILNTQESVDLERDDDDGEFVAEAVVAPGSWDMITIVVDEVRFELDGEDYVVQLENGTVEVEGNFWTESGESTQVLVWLDVISALREGGALDEARQSTQDSGDQQQQQQQDDDRGRETQSQDDQFQDERQRQDADSDGQFDATGDRNGTTAQRLDVDLQLEAHSVLIVPDAFDILSLVNDFNEANAIDAQGNEAENMAGGDDTGTGTQGQDQTDQDQTDQDQMDPTDENQTVDQS